MSLAARLAAAADHSAEFLERVHKLGYGEVALDYLEHLQSTGKVPPDLKETWDLQMHLALKASVKEAFNARERADRLARSQQYLDKFLKEHSNHPQAAAALESSAETTLYQGREKLQAARLLKDPQQQNELALGARQTFEDARKQYLKALELYRAQMAQADKALAEETRQDDKRPRRAVNQPKVKKLAEAYAKVRGSWLQMRIQGVMIDYLIAQTYLDVKDPKRAQLLNKAGKAFEDLYQENRNDPETPESLVAAIAGHMWYGRCRQELGDLTLARDVFDEVLVWEPEDAKEKETGLEQWLAYVRYFKMLIDVKERGAAKVLPDYQQWLQQRRALKNFDGYQGVCLEVAKGLLAAAEKGSSTERTKPLREAMVLLRESSKVRSEFQGEILKLMREHSAKSADGLALSFDDALELARDAVASGELEAAAKAYKQAIEIGEREKLKKNEQLLAQAKDSLHSVEYRLAFKQFNDGKHAEAGVEFERIAREHSQATVAPAAAAMSVQAAYQIYATAEANQQKDAAWQLLLKRAEYALAKWPDKAEADDVRMTKGRASLVRKQYDEALAVFENVNDRSERYPMGLYLAGKTHYELFRIEQAKAAKDRDQKKASEHLAKAEKQLAASLALQRKAADPREPPARELVDTQLVLADVALDGEKPNDAVGYAQPLVDAARAAKPDPSDVIMIRATVAAARAYIALGDLAKAAQTLAVLAALGVDAPMVNDRLVKFIRAFDEEAEKAGARALNARSAGNPAEAQSAEDKHNVVMRLTGELIKQVSSRKQLSLVALIELGDRANRQGHAELADSIYQRVLPEAEKDPKLSKAVTGILAKRVGFLRQKKQFQEGLSAADKLIAANKNALEPLMEKGRLLQDWAAADPAKFDDAVAHWNDLRSRLERGKKGAEYFEVVLNVANCLVEETRKTKNKEKAQQAIQLLHAVKVKNPNLSGVGMAARFDALRSDALKLIGAAPRSGEAARN